MENIFTYKSLLGEKTRINNLMSPLDEVRDKISKGMVKSHEMVPTLTSKLHVSGFANREIRSVLM